MSSILSLVQDVCTELGLPQPLSAIASTDLNVLQMVGLARGLGDELSNQHPWQRLATEYDFTIPSITGTLTTTSGNAIATVSSTAGLDNTYLISGGNVFQATQIQSVDSATQITMNYPATATGSSAVTFIKGAYSLPSDFNWEIQNTHWDKTKRWQLLGPKSAQEWAWVRSAYISNGPRMRYRILNGLFQVWPPQPGANVCFEYQSNNWVRSGSGAAKSRFTADDDTCVFRDRLMILGIKLRFLEAKGLDSGPVERAFNLELSASKGQDADAPILNMVPTLRDPILGLQNVPDTGYGT